VIEHQFDRRPFVVREAIWLFEHDAVSPIIMTVQSDTEVSQRVAVGQRELAITAERRHGVTSSSIVAVRFDGFPAEK
jgi:hypothetical protein